VIGAEGENFDIDFSLEKINTALWVLPEYE